MERKGAFAIALICIVVAGVGGQAPAGAPTTTPEAAKTPAVAPATAPAKQKSSPAPSTSTASTPPASAPAPAPVKTTVPTPVSTPPAFSSCFGSYELSTCKITSCFCTNDASGQLTTRAVPAPAPSKKSKKENAPAPSPALLGLPGSSPEASTPGPSGAANENGAETIRSVQNMVGGLALGWGAIALIF
ncbi:hypothetical protein SLEP1_g33902 [Rubroshorea leprosula]|uniref:Uncharacterized protein n=1 Tax=Rubroshorea leprosula TaxID=152421 RepID=A0AAV5KID1_9ROSI|nr:hypothetical protein SLEP1_g33902 [Rubroshorea leprosula]